MFRLLVLLVLLAACEDTGALTSTGAPLAVLAVEPAQVYIGDPVRFDAGASSDSLGVAARFSDTALSGFHFDFGDEQAVDVESWYQDHSYAEPGTYEATLTVSEGEDSSSVSAEVEVTARPPAVIGLDVSGDDVAVIGEWIVIEGRGFREDNVPSVEFEHGILASRVEVDSEYEIFVQVPPRTPSGWNDVVVDFPNDDDGDAVLETWVTRFALATDAWRGRVYLTEFGSGDQHWARSQTLELPNAAVVKISGDGAFALVGDARFQATASPSVIVVDLTADWNPVVSHELSGLGVGPLQDIAIARDAPVGVIVDATGFVVLDLTDPLDPVQVGDRIDFQFAEMAPTAAELSPDGTRLSLLSTFNDRVRFYTLTPTGPIYDTESVDVGPQCQDMDVLDDAGLLYVLGGGGEGAMPPDLSFDNTTLTVIDLLTTPAANIGGEGAFLPLEGEVPIPFDLAVGPSGTAYISTLDQNFATLSSALSDITDSVTDLGAWTDLVEALQNLGFGAVRPVDGALTGELLVGDGLFSPFGFQTGLDVRYDERLYVATAIGLGTTLSVLEDGELIHLSLDIDYGVAVGNLITGDVEVYPMYTAGVVSYVDFQLQYDLGPLTALLLPPYAMGDVAIQP